MHPRLFFVFFSSHAPPSEKIAGSFIEARHGFPFRKRAAEAQKAQHPRDLIRTRFLLNRKFQGKQKRALAKRLFRIRIFPIATRELRQCCLGAGKNGVFCLRQILFHSLPCRILRQIGDQAREHKKASAVPKKPSHLLTLIHKMHPLPLVCIVCGRALPYVTFIL